MNWYYKDNEMEFGPLGKDEMNQLVREGTITDATLVRNDSSPQWMTFAQLKAGAAQKKQASPPPSPQPASQPYGQTAGATAAAGDVTCAECGFTFTEDEVVKYKDIYVCAECKPAFVQKLKEGAQLPNTLVYGGFWIRFGAKFIDNMLLYMVNMFLAFFVGLFVTAGFAAQGEPNFDDPTSVAAFIVLFLIQLLIPVVYTTFFVGKYAATPGKMACGLKVVTPDGGRVSYPRALGRYFAEILSGLILLMGYIMAAYDEEKRALHDRICETRVIKK